MAHPPADPAAATVSPHERTRTPPRPRMRVDVHPPGPVQLHPQITQRIEEELTLHPDGHAPPVRQRAEDTVDVEAAVREVLATVEEEVTDHGHGTPDPPKQRPYADLPYEERLCRLLEDIADNTRKTELRLAAEEHRRNAAAAEQLLKPGHLREERRTLLRWVEHWCLDPKLKGLVVKALAVGVSLGTSLVASGSTMGMLMELLEHYLRASVTLP